ncbi:hypothetical protein BDR06DRAFT_954175 [Suillus hirtellus]|nr:hypothetical protein BDR06DRAFT_954175 [Suillus hirtellus]
MSDEQLCQLVRAWPKLQVLEISSWIAIDVATVLPTFHGLMRLLVPEQPERPTHAVSNDSTRERPPA